MRQSRRRMYKRKGWRRDHIHFHFTKEKRKYPRRRNGFYLGVTHVPLHKHEFKETTTRWYKAWKIRLPRSHRKLSCPVFLHRQIIGTVSSVFSWILVCVSVCDSFLSAYFMHNQQVGGRNVTRITSCLLYADRQDRQCNTKYHQTLILFSREGIDEWQAHKKKQVFTDWFFDCFGPSPFISMWASLSMTQVTTNAQTPHQG